VSAAVRTAVRIAELVAIARLALPFRVSAPVGFSVRLTPLRLRRRQNQPSGMSAVAGKV